MPDCLKPALTFVALAILGLAASGVLAQPAGGGAAARRLDDARFIQGLRERGLKDLVLFFIEKHPPKDPVVKQEIIIEQHKLAFEEALQSNRAQAPKAAGDVLTSYRDLFKMAPAGDPKGPVWKTEFAAYVIQVVLPVINVNAAEFVEFGTPTPDQRQAFDALVAETVAVMEQASDEMFQLRGDLPKRDDFIINFENSGFWDRLNREIGDLQLPLYRAWINYYGSMTAKPVGNLNLAAGEMKTVLKQEVNPAAEAMIHSLHGRIMLARALQNPPKPGAAAPAAAPGSPAPAPAKAPAAIPADPKKAVAAPADPKKAAVAAAPAPPADPIAQAVAELRLTIDNKDANPSDVLLANLAVSKALDAQGKKKEAVELVDSLKKLPVAAQSPTLLIIIYDRHVALTGDQNLLAKAPEDPAAGQFKGFIAEWIGNRFAAKPMAVEDLAKEAPVAVLGQVNGMIRAGDEAKAAKDEAEAKKSFDNAVAALKALIERPELPPDVAGKALFQLGLVQFKRQQPVLAADAWTQMAEKFPQMGESEGAAKNAVLICQALWKDNKDKPLGAQVGDLFERALRALQKNFEFTPFAKAHVFTLADLLLERGQFAEAAEWFAKVAQDHPLWLSAQYKRAIAFHSLWLKSEAKVKPAAAKNVPPAVDEALAAVRAAQAQAKPDGLDKLLEMEGDLILMKAEVFAEGLGKPQDAAKLLDGFDGKFGKFARLMALKRPLQVAILMAEGKMAEAVAEVNKFREQFPDQAGPIIKGVLDKVLRQAKDVRAMGDAAKAGELGKTAVQLATALLEWARARPEYKDPARLMGFEIMLAESHLAAGENEKAADLFEELYKRPGAAGIRDVLDGKQRADLAAKRYIGALDAGKKILDNIKDTKDPLFWPSWEITMLALDAVIDAEADAARKTSMANSIYTGILKLERQDPKLGGGTPAETLARLKLKHQPK